MKLDLEPGWVVHAVGGTTGGAYLGTYENKKYFLKLNASPFLAALALEHITPKLIWTKRLATGDILTAQVWVEGKTLRRDQMQMARVPALLRRVHHSPLLKRMLTKVNGPVESPFELRDRVAALLMEPIRRQTAVCQALHHLATDPGRSAVLTVCHGDLNHKNWLLGDDDQLYLVDWDQAALADPALDLAALLIDYVPFSSWSQWLASYGLAFDAALERRLFWYAQLHLLMTLTRLNEDDRVRQEAVLQQLNRLNNRID